MQMEHFICKKESSLHPWLFVKGTSAMGDRISWFLHLLTFVFNVCGRAGPFFLISQSIFVCTNKRHINPIGVTLQNDYPFGVKTLDSEIMVNDGKKSRATVKVVQKCEAHNKSGCLCLFFPLHFNFINEERGAWKLVFATFKFPACIRWAEHNSRGIRCIVGSFFYAHNTLQWTST